MSIPIELPESTHKVQKLNGRSPENGFLDLAILLLRHKKFLIYGTFAVCVISVAYSFLATKFYTAMTVILPSKSQSSSPLGALVGDLPISGLVKGLDLMGQGDNSRFLSILQSRRMADIMIQNFDLKNHYRFNPKRKLYIENVVKRYHTYVKAEEDENGNVVISVTDSIPEFAANMANSIARVLDSLAYDLNRENARGSRIFFEERIKVIKQTLDSVHHAFADFQIKNNYIDMEQQVKATIDAFASIEAQGMAVDLQKALLTQNYNSNAELDEVTLRKKIIDEKLRGYMKKGSGSLVLPLKQTPEIGIHYAYLYRDVKVQEALYAFLLQMYEQAKFREANNAPVVTVLEKAQTPQKKTSPNRPAICILSFLIGFCLLSFVVVIQQWLESQKIIGSPVYFKLREIGVLLRRWQ